MLKKIPIPKFRKKDIYVSIATILQVLAASVLFFRAFYQENPALDIWDWILIGLGILIIGIAIGLSMLLLQKRLFLILWFLLILIFPVFFGLNPVFLASLLLFWICLFWGYRIHLLEEDARMKLRIPAILSRSLPIVITSLCVLIAISYYVSPAFGTLELEIEFPRFIFDNIWEFLVQSQETFTTNGLGNKILNEKLGEQIYQKLNVALAAFIDKAFGANKQQYLSVAVIFGLFVGLRALSIPLMWVVILLTWGIIIILRIFGVAKIGKVAAEKEILVL